MVTITTNALTVIRRVTGHPTMEAGSGVRIARRDAPGEPLEVRAVHQPRPGDHVVETEGARLILGPEAATHVEGRRLDARTDADGRVQFVLQAA